MSRAAEWLESQFDDVQEQFSRYIEKRNQQAQNFHIGIYADPVPGMFCLKDDIIGIATKGAKWPDPFEIDYLDDEW